MIRQAIQEAKKPKNFFIHLPKPASKKWEVISKKPESGYEISVNEKEYCIDFDGKPVIYVTGSYGVEWDDQWDWGDFASGAGKKIENMIKYLKELD